jgi:deoxyxylulose-5-phosphate synthase
VHVDVLGLPTRFIQHGEANRILSQLGLDADGIERRLRDHISRR